MWNAVKEQRRSYKYVFRATIIATALAMALTVRGDIFHVIASVVETTIYIFSH